MPNRIKEETKERIILGSRSLKFELGCFFIILGTSLVCYSLLYNSYYWPSFIASGFCFILGYDSFNDESITFDKKEQKVILKNYFMKRLNSVKEIPFSDIRKILIETHYNKDDETGRVYETWDIQLNTINNYYFLIYSPYYYIDALKVAKKISKIIDKEISHYTTDFREIAAPQD